MRKIVLRFFLVILSLFFAVGICEYVLSKEPKPFTEVTPVYNFSQFNVNYGIEPKPNLDYEEYTSRVKTNSDATFGPEIQKDAENNIVHLGDSYTAGPGIEYEKNYPYLLESSLEAKTQKDFQTVILGMGGSSPTQQAIIFSKKLTDVKPKLVVYELYENDLNDDFIFTFSQYKAKIDTFARFPHWFTKTAIGKKLFVFLSDRLAKKNLDYYESNKEKFRDNPEVLSLYTRPALDEIKKRTESLDSKMILFYIPSGYEFSNEYSTSEAQPRSPLANFSKDWSEKNNVPYVDMYDTFLASNSATLNELYLGADRGFHLNETATQLVADKLLELIDKNKIF